MSQHDTLEQDFLRLTSSLNKLGLTSLTPEQRDIFDQAMLTAQSLEQHLFDDYIDFEEICDKLSDAIYVADKNGTTIYVNDFYQKLSGITKSEIVGENVHRINKEKKLYENGVIPDVLKKQKHIEKIGYMTRTQTTVSIIGDPIFDKNGKLKYAVASDKDINQLESVKEQLLNLREYEQKAEGEINYLRTRQFGNSEMIFKSDQMVQAVSTALAVAPTDATVLITGESGTGKELISNQIYQASSRSSQPFLKINCSAIPESLMESELFGYEPGSFTGASKTGKTGIFELANNGTLMLDEIGEMPLQMQSKLLRVLQNKEITKVGGTKSIPVNVRIIAATNKDLLQGIRENTFREDLYYRLNVVPIHLAPLRERTDDIELLIQHFLEIYTKKYNKQIDIHSDAVQLMETYPWPGNTRELENVIERLVVINQTNVIDRKTVSMVLGLTEEEGNVKPENEYDIKAATAAVEKHIIRKAVSDFGSKRKAAEAMGIDHSTLVKKCQRYGL